jgi:hypothetical protein
LSRVLGEQAESEEALRAGVSVTCFTGTKVQILTPEELFACSAQVFPLLALLVQSTDSDT